jgi:hypothetical protein
MRRNEEGRQSNHRRQFLRYGPPDEPRDGQSVTRFVSATLLSTSGVITNWCSIPWHHCRPTSFESALLPRSHLPPTQSQVSVNSVSATPSYRGDSEGVEGDGGGVADVDRVDVG